jgi:toxin ParE1/3/4
LRWSLAAADDLEQINKYLRFHHLSFAGSTIRRLYDRAKSLWDFPFSGREGRKPGTRELVLAPLAYVMVYAVDEFAIQILRILHTSRDWQQTNP